jgi:hypothetical protein
MKAAIPYALLAIALICGLVGLSISSVRMQRLEAQLQRQEDRAPIILAMAREEDARRIESLSRELTQDHADSFERQYDLDTNFRSACVWEQQSLRCSAVRARDMANANFHCSTQGCEFVECGVVK